MPGSSLNNRGVYLDITVPTAKASRLLAEIQRSEKFSIDPAHTREDSANKIYYIRILLGHRDEYDCICFLRQQLGSLADQTLQRP